MKQDNRKDHWEHIYKNKQLAEVSWYQPVPQTSLDFVGQLGIRKTAKIIDIGGGDSFFVDELLDRGYTDITVLDISEAAIERAKERLGERADRVKWIVRDVVQFNPEEQYDLWHDRAAFHFLTREQDIVKYIETAGQCLGSSGYMVIGTFSEQGPKKCSGIEITQYSEESMENRFKDYFEKIKCVSVDHQTPFNTVQNFVFCSFKKRV